MHHAAAMRPIQRTRNLCPDLHNVLEWQRPFLEAFLQRLAFHALHDQIIDAVLVPDIVEDANVRMIQTGDGLGFALEALFADGIGREVRRKNLDGDGALQARIVRAIHLTHTSRAEWRLDFIRTESCACREAHRWREL